VTRQLRHSWFHHCKQPSPQLLLLLLLPLLIPTLLLLLLLLLLVLQEASCVQVQQLHCPHYVRLACLHARGPCLCPACHLLLLLLMPQHQTHQNLDLWGPSHLPYQHLRTRLLQHLLLLLLLTLLLLLDLLLHGLSVCHWLLAAAAVVVLSSCWQFQCRWCLLW
jgi:hypothetical protein